MARLEELIEDAADPVGAQLVVERLRGAGQPVSPRIDHDELMATAAVRLADASRSLADAVVRSPSLLVVVDHLVERETEELVAEAIDVVAALEDRVTPSDALRSWKRREFLRIALRDLLGHSDVAGVGRELASLADACLAASLTVAAPNRPMAIVAMGKLGGSELNYASDVDVLFVHEGDEFDAARAARRVIATMSEVTKEGIVFRTDADLRPDGKAGALSRTVAAYQDYYGGRALMWERQALIKARPVAGDQELASEWMAATRVELWDRARSAGAVPELRAHKARTEQALQREGLLEREVKRGRGGIRDVEMAVQILQFVHGGADQAIRSATTLVALDQLSRRGYIDEADGEHLAVAYRYLRTVEHRLQLQQEQQVYALPVDAAQLDRLARVMGYRDRPTEQATENAVTQFMDSHRRHQASVRSIFERLFFRPLLEALSGRGRWDPGRLHSELAALGFSDLVATRAAIEELTAGASRNAVQLRVLMPQLMEWLSGAPNPDLGLLQLRIVLDGPARSMTVMPLLRESAAITERLCRVLGSSKVAGQGLRRHPELVAELGDLDQLAKAPAPAELREELIGQDPHEAVAPVGAAREPHDAVMGPTLPIARLRTLNGRQQTRLALRAVLSEDFDVAAELSDLADVLLDSALPVRAREGFAIIAMGKLGGRELAFPSDLDVIFVHRQPPAQAEAVAATLLRTIGGSAGEARIWEIDARLRPEGNQGVLARTLGSYREYYMAWSQVWERQALIKARFCAGDPALGAAFEALRDQISYRGPLTGEHRAELRHIKRRVENERIRRGEDKALHLKLGPGGMVDVEFTVQLLQLTHGLDHPSVRHPNTLAALASLEAEGLMSAGDAESLRASYRFCTRARNAMYLRSGVKSDILPAGGTQRIDVDRLLAVEDCGAAFATVAAPARAVVQRLFYGS
ncbi:MAG: bifunctional [glutamine synthetase] adenylyltransferase/[glutamine synthetase]-adenylyl-L-tyrosine phosphorylase [Acidimicrobiales bacterium]